MLKSLATALCAIALAIGLGCGAGGDVPGEEAASFRPNIVLVMADDMGWGEAGYYDHPVLETPNLDAMAANGLRFDRFYAGAFNCSPTRATVMTGRSNDRTGVENHGYALRLQERTVAQALRDSGYATGHFGKWHLNGLRGAGVPVLASDDHGPGAFGFDEWLSVTNFFDLDPIMSRKGEFVELEGDSSEIIVEQALEFIEAQAEAGGPFFTVIWYGSPHDPFRALEKDMATFRELDERSRTHYGELVAMDRSIGELRAGLRRLNIEQDTLVWFCSDNGGLGRIEPPTVGGLRGLKNTIYEGGLRVPAIIEWPGGIANPRVTSFPAATMDMFPTLAALAGLPDSAMMQPQDGIDLTPLLQSEMGRREKPIPFRHTGHAALVDNDYKLVQPDITVDEIELYDLAADPNETTDISAAQPEVAQRLAEALARWNESVDASIAGEDYPSGTADPAESQPRTWMELSEYQPYFEEWRKRPEYASRLPAPE